MFTSSTNSITALDAKSGHVISDNGRENLSLVTPFRRVEEWKFSATSSYPRR